MRLNKSVGTKETTVTEKVDDVYRKVEMIEVSLQNLSTKLVGVGPTVVSGWVVGNTEDSSSIKIEGSAIAATTPYSIGQKLDLANNVLDSIEDILEELREKV